MSKRYPVAGPSITRREIEYVTDAVATAWYADAGKYHDRFERRFAQHLDVPYVMALPSCTSGIHLALAALGIGPGDEVIVPEVTWIATSAPVSYVGATPIFVDVDPVTWCICPASVEAAITPRTKAIITVDLYGNMADYDAILTLAGRHGLKVIEDAAEAAGAVYKGRPAGSFGDAGVFSFHGSKTLTTGEGGLLATRDKSIFDRANFLRDHGRVPGDFSFENSEVAFKYKMSSMQAALGLAQIERLQELMEIKRRAFHWYQEGVGNIKGLRMNDPGPDVEGAYWMVSIVWEPEMGIDKKSLRDALGIHGIDTRPFFSPLSSLAAYQHLPGAMDYPARNPNAYRLRTSGINLPSSLALEFDDVAFICDKVRGVFRKLV